MDKSNRGPRSEPEVVRRSERRGEAERPRDTAPSGLAALRSTLGSTGRSDDAPADALRRMSPAARATTMRGLNTAMGNAQAGRVASAALPGPRTAARSGPTGKRRVVQAKLRVSACCDPLEVEADALADSLLRPRTSASPPAGDGTRGPTPATPGRRHIEWTFAPGTAQEVGLDVPEALGADLAALEVGGRPLDAGERAFFEARFGVDLADVRVHSGGSAAALCTALQARAFAHGRHIAVENEALTLGTADARRLMAHELVHVLQQGGIQLRSVPQGEASSTSPGPAIEHHQLTRGDPSMIRRDAATIDLKQLPKVSVVVRREGGANIVKVQGIDAYRVTAKTPGAPACRGSSGAYSSLKGKEYARAGNSVSLRYAISLAYEEEVTVAPISAGIKALQTMLPSVEFTAYATLVPRPKPVPVSALKLNIARQQLGQSDGSYDPDELIGPRMDLALAETIDLSSLLQGPNGDEIARTLVEAAKRGRDGQPFDSTVPVFAGKDVPAWMKSLRARPGKAGTLEIWSADGQPVVNPDGSYMTLGPDGLPVRRNSITSDVTNRQFTDNVLVPYFTLAATDGVRTLADGRRLDAAQWKDYLAERFQVLQQEANRKLVDLNEGVAIWNELQGGWSALASVPVHFFAGRSRDDGNNILAKTIKDVEFALAQIPKALTPAQLAAAEKAVMDVFRRGEAEFYTYKDNVIVDGGERTVTVIKVVAVAAVAAAAGPAIFAAAGGKVVGATLGAKLLATAGSALGSGLLTGSLGGALEGVDRGFTWENYGKGFAQNFMSGFTAGLTAGATSILQIEKIVTASDLAKYLAMNAATGGIDNVANAALHNATNLDPSAPEGDLQRAKKSLIEEALKGAGWGVVNGLTSHLSAGLVKPGAAGDTKAALARSSADFAIQRGVDAAIAGLQAASNGGSALDIQNAIVQNGLSGMATHAVGKLGQARDKRREAQAPPGGKRPAPSAARGAPDDDVQTPVAGPRQKKPTQGSDGSDTQAPVAGPRQKKPTQGSDGSDSHAPTSTPVVTPPRRKAGPRPGARSMDGVGDGAPAVGAVVAAPPPVKAKPEQAGGSPGKGSTSGLKLVAAPLGDVKPHELAALAKAAAAVTPDLANNCASDVLAIDAALAGESYGKAPTLFNKGLGAPGKAGPLGAEYHVPVFDAMFGPGQAVHGAEQARRVIETMGDGARVIIYGGEESGAGHFYNAVVIRGKAVPILGLAEADHAVGMWGEGSKMMVWRTDAGDPGVRASARPRAPDGSSDPPPRRSVGAAEDHVDAPGGPPRQDHVSTDGPPPGPTPPAHADAPVEPGRARPAALKPEWEGRKLTIHLEQSAGFIEASYSKKLKKLLIYKYEIAEDFRGGGLLEDLIRAGVAAAGEVDVIEGYMAGTNLEALKAAGGDLSRTPAGKARARAGFPVHTYDPDTHMLVSRRAADAAGGGKPPPHKGGATPPPRSEGDGGAGRPAGGLPGAGAAAKGRRGPVPPPALAPGVFRSPVHEQLFRMNDAEFAHLGADPSGASQLRELRTLGRRVGDQTDSGATGAHLASSLPAVLAAAQEHVQAHPGQSVRMLTAQVKNLSGLNAEYGTTGARQVMSTLINEMTLSIRLELQSARTSVALVYLGGSSVALVVVGPASANKVFVAVHNGLKKAQKYADSAELPTLADPTKSSRVKGIKHPKFPHDPAETGSGIAIVQRAAIDPRTPVGAQLEVWGKILADQMERADAARKDRNPRPPKHAADAEVREEIPDVARPTGPRSRFKLRIDAALDAEQKLRAAGGHDAPGKLPRAQIHEAARILREVDADALGLHAPGALIPMFEDAIAWKRQSEARAARTGQAGERAAVIAYDVRNLGGLGHHVGRDVSPLLYKEMVDIIRATLARELPTAALCGCHYGGDEFGFLAVGNFNQEQVKAAHLKATAAVKEWVDQQWVRVAATDEWTRLQEIPHLKEGKRPGTGVTGDVVMIEEQQTGRDVLESLNALDRAKAAARGKDRQ